MDPMKNIYERRGIQVSTTRQDSLTKALDLALNYEFAVFPCDRFKRPLTEHGHLSASTDPEAVATMFGAYPDAVVAVHVGASNLAVLDVDIRDDGRDGFSSLELQWVDIPQTVNYETPSGGSHYLFRPPEGLNLPPRHEYRGWRGIDRKSGSAYICFYADSTVLLDAEIAPAPTWLLDVTATTGVGSSFEGGLDEWLSGLEDGPISAKVLDAVKDFPSVPFGHPDLISAQYRLVRLASEGAIGVREGLEKLRSLWLTDPWDSQDYRFEFDAGLSGAIAKAGLEDEAIRSLPEYQPTLGLLSDENVGLFIGTSQPKPYYFKVIKALVATDLSDAQVATLVWHGPTVRSNAREWGIDYLYAQIAEARLKAEPGNNPVPMLEETNDNEYDLLTEEERAVVEQCVSFPDRYVSLAASRHPLLNEPYHRMASWNLLSLGFGMFGFIPMTENKKMGLNLYTIALGDSSSGKTDSTYMRNAWADEIFQEDKGYNLGSNMSLEWLQETLLRDRDGKVALFEADEAALVFRQMSDPKAYNAGIDTFLTKLYEGIVPSKGTKGAKDIAGKTALVSFNIALMGTPVKVMDQITEEQFEDGSLARYIWAYGEPAIDIPGEETESQVEEYAAEAEFDPVARAGAVEFYALRRLAGPENRRPILATREALARIGRNRDQMKRATAGHRRYSVFAPAIRRLGDNVRKAASLLALSEGSTTVELHHVLLAIEEAENWLRDLVRASEGVVASKFQREVDDFERYIIAQGGKVTRAKLFNTFQRYEPRDAETRVQSLLSQGRIVESGLSYAINTKRE